MKKWLIIALIGSAPVQSASSVDQKKKEIRGELSVSQLGDIHCAAEPNTNCLTYVDSQPVETLQLLDD